MQFFILFIGAMVFVFYLFVQPPVLFQHAELERIAGDGRITQPIEAQYDRAFEHRRAGGAGAGRGAPRGRYARREQRRHGGVPRGAEGDRRCARARPRSWWSAPAARRASATPTTSSSRS